jgi:tripartite-type tricarboxylate transporter receptor subunit TctC
MKSSAAARTPAAIGVFFAAISAASGIASAQTAAPAPGSGYPNRLITIVAPFSAGGDSDLAARNLAQVTQQYLGQSAIVVNKAGASGVIGSAFVKDAKPDGYTLLLARVGSQAMLPALTRNPPYKWNDFTFLGLLELNPYVCAVKSDSRIKVFADLVDEIRRNPGKLNYSTAGVGTIHEMGPQMLFDILKLGKDAAVQIPFKGGGEASAALLAGQVEFGCSNLATMLQFIKAGQLRALLVTTSERYKDIPAVPTAREAGYPQLERITGWSALYGPPGMDREAVARWSEALQKIAKDPTWVASTERIGSMPRVLGPEETAKFAQEQFETYERLGKAIGLELKQ